MLRNGTGTLLGTLGNHLKEETPYTKIDKLEIFMKLDIFCVVSLVY